VEAEERGAVEETLFEHVVPPGAPLPPRLLTNRPFLWLVLSSAVANLGLWAYFAAVWADAAYRFHASPAQMSILLASFSVPFVLLVPVQGILVDRWSPKWLSVTGILIALLAVPPAWVASSIEALYLSSFLVGAGLGAIVPARSALTGLLVEERRLVQANGMLSGAVQLALIVGPLAGALVLRSVGNDVLYAAVVPVIIAAALLALLVPDLRQGGARPALSLRDLVDGAATSWRTGELRILLWVSGTAWMVVNIYWTLQPLFVKSTLHLSRDAVGFIWSAQGVGAVVGSVFLYRAKNGTGRELRFVGAGLVISAAGLLGFVATSSYPVALLATVVYGGGFSLFFSSSMALIQRLAGDEKRGRVTSVFAVLQEGTAIVAAIAIVGLGDLVSVRPSLVVTGMLLAAAGVLALSGLTRLRMPAAEPAIARDDD
jgi:MFS family permease